MKSKIQNHYENKNKKYKMKIYKTNNNYKYISKPRNNYLKFKS